MTTVAFPLNDLLHSSCSQIVVRDPAYDPHIIQASDELLTLSHTEDGLALYEYARRATGSVLEIGTYCGHTALFLGYGIKNRERPENRNDSIFTIDTHINVDLRDRNESDLAAMQSRNQPASFRRLVHNAKEYGIWDILHPIIDDADGAHELWKDGTCLGLLFIDGDHMQARRDFLNYERFLLPGAYVCFHDYWPECPHVMIDVDRLVAEGVIEPIERVQTLFVARANRSGNVT